MQIFRRPKLIALDLDGTVVNGRNEIPQCNIDALRACHAAGIQLAFLTGRRPRTATKHLDVIGLPALVATNSGSLLWEYPAWNSLRQQFFPPELVQPIAAMLAPHSVNFYVDSQRHGFEFFYLERHHSSEMECYLERWGLQARRITDAAEMSGYDITQIAMPNTREESTRLCDEVISRFDGQVLAMAVRWPLLNKCIALEIFHPDANKGTAIEFFADRLKLENLDVLAAGDDVNDLAMLCWAGHGVAMPDASPELVEIADEQLSGDNVESLAELLDRVRELSE